ncbi:aldehyde-activating protein [Maritimibacter sp. 55A14]|uniref:GFA family protein n=1 Tax=Maritimibacter sp. 55A14 TaxID=2174844 RepID=UPI000D61F125|nr:GFA family protein [Maritimibacter sp. 55A14]PWE31345.1 aldehyde-activating protein [Maritimibacter sp. 55A14]
MSVEGGCLCGAVRYRVDGPLRPIIACHCLQCRKTSGHHVAATSAQRGQVEIAGEVQWYASSDTARRGFCSVCGSNLFWDGPSANLSIFAGTIDGDPGVRLTGHIFCADKGDYYEIGDGLPQAEAADPALTTQVGGA